MVSGFWFVETLITVGVFSIASLASAGSTAGPSLNVESTEARSKQITGWRLGGNSGFNPELSFFGTSDNTDIIMKRNGVRAAVLGTNQTSFGVGAMTASTGVGNTAIGTSALAANTTGNLNVAVGADALSVATKGQHNTAIGAGALGATTIGIFNVAVGRLALGANTTGSDNVAVGRNAMGGSTSAGRTVAVGTSALSSLSTGSFNTGVGYEALNATSTGSYNTAISHQAMFYNTTGSENVSIGHNALWDNESGNENVAVGNLSMLQTNAWRNTAVGYATLNTNTSGAANVAIGWSALSGNTTGTTNIGLGYRAGGLPGVGQQTGNNNIYIGTDARPANTARIDNAIAIGRNAIVSASNTLVLGGTGNDAVNVGIGLTAPTYQLQLSSDSAAKPGSATWDVASDARLKDVRTQFTRGLDALESLTPVYYNYKAGNALGLPSDEEFVGIIAQDAQESIPEAVRKTRKGYLQVQTDSIIWTMLNAIKELHSHNSKLELEVERLKSMNDEILTRLEKLERK